MNSSTSGGRPKFPRQVRAHLEGIGRLAVSLEPGAQMPGLRPSACSARRISPSAAAPTSICASVRLAGREAALQCGPGGAQHPGQPRAGVPLSPDEQFDRHRDARQPAAPARAIAARDSRTSARSPAGPRSTSTSIGAMRCEPQRRAPSARRGDHGRSRSRRSACARRRGTRRGRVAQRDQRGHQPEHRRGRLAQRTGAARSCDQSGERSWRRCRRATTRPSSSGSLAPGRACGQSG